MLTSESSNTDDSHIILENSPPFCESLHVSFIEGLVEKLDTSIEGAMADHLRMSGVYWSLTALHILRTSDQVDDLMNVTTTNKSNHSRGSIIDWLFTCLDRSTGGFGGSTGHDAHLLYTLSALQILALHDQLDDERLDKEKIIMFIVNLQQLDGSFAGDEWGEIDTRFSYCALSALSILGALKRIDVKRAVDYILQCRNLDGGFGAVIGAESHAGQGESDEVLLRMSDYTCIVISSTQLTNMSSVFCCIGALSIAGSLDKLTSEDIDLLGWWLSERQVDSGGLNGRPEKQADVVSQTPTVVHPRCPTIIHDSSAHNTSLHVRTVLFLVDTFRSIYNGTGGLDQR